MTGVRLYTLFCFLSAIIIGSARMDGTKAPWFQAVSHLWLGTLGGAILILWLIPKILPEIWEFKDENKVLIWKLQRIFRDIKELRHVLMFLFGILCAVETWKFIQGLIG